MVTTVTMSGPGSTTIVEDTAAAVQAQTLAQQALGNSIILQIGSTEVPGTLLTIMSAQADTMDQIYGILQDIHDRMEEMNIQQTNIEKRMEDQTKGMAAMVHVATEQATTAQMAYVDQVKNNQFQQQTTNNALAAVGKPPTVVTPQAILDKIKANLSDLSIVKAEQNATNYIFTKINETITAAYTTAETWYLSSAVGTFITEKWGLLKAKVKALFGVEEAKKAVAQTRRTRNSVKAGNPSTL
jgi:hypothetical protein